MNGLRERYKKLIADAGLASLPSNKVPEGQTWHITRLAFEGSSVTSGGNTRARYYIDGHGDKLYLGEQDAPAADTLYKDPDPIDLLPGESLVLEWDQAQASTTLQMQLTGEIIFTQGS